MLVRRAAIDDVGPMDEGFFLYYEDTDWCHRMRDHGWEVLLEPGAQRGASSRRFRGPRGHSRLRHIGPRSTATATSTACGVSRLARASAFACADCSEALADARAARLSHGQLVGRRPLHDRSRARAGRARRHRARAGLRRGGGPARTARPERTTSCSRRRIPSACAGRWNSGASPVRPKPDIVHCPHFPTPVPARGPLVVTLHDLTPLLVPGVMPSALKRVVYRRWNARAARLADRIIVPSRATAADVERALPGRAGQAGGDRRSRRRLLLRPDRAAHRRRWPVWLRRPYLLSMGNTKPHKDLPTLLRAFARAGGLGARSSPAAGRRRAPRLPRRGAGGRAAGDTRPRGVHRPFGRRRAAGAVRRRRGICLSFAPRGVRPAAAGGHGTRRPRGLRRRRVVAGGGRRGRACFSQPGDADALVQALARLLDDPAHVARACPGGPRPRRARFTWKRTAQAYASTAYRDALKHGGSACASRGDDAE